MKKLFALSLISFLKIAPVSSKSFTPVSSNISKCETLLIPKNFRPVNAHINSTIQKAGKGTLVVLDESGSTVLKQQVELVAGENNHSQYFQLKEGQFYI